MTPTFDPILAKLRTKDLPEKLIDLVNSNSEDIAALSSYLTPIRVKIRTYNPDNLTPLSITVPSPYDDWYAFFRDLSQNRELTDEQKAQAFIDFTNSISERYFNRIASGFIMPVVLEYYDGDTCLAQAFNDTTQHLITNWSGLFVNAPTQRQYIIVQAQDNYILTERENDNYTTTTKKNGLRTLLAFRDWNVNEYAWNITEITDALVPFDSTSIARDLQSLRESELPALQQQIERLVSRMDRVEGTTIPNIEQLMQDFSNTLETFETEAKQIIAQVEKIEQNYTDFQNNIISGFNDFAGELVTGLEEFVLGPELTAVYNSDDCCITLTQDTESKSLFLFKAYDEYGRSDIRLTLLGQQDIILFRSQVERKKGIFYHNNYYIAYEILYFEELGNLAGVPSRYYRWLIISAQDAIELYTAYQQYKDGDLDYTLLLQAIENMVGSENISNIYYSDDDLFPMLDSQIQKLNAYNSGYDDGLQGHENNNTYESGTDLYNSYESGYSDGYAEYEASQTPEPEPEPDPEPDPDPEPTDENNPEDNPEE